MSYRARVVALAALALTTVPLPARAQTPNPHTIVRKPPSIRETAPESGAGLMAAGSFLIAGGAALIGLSSYMTATVNGEWALGIVGGAAMAGGGSAAVYFGSRRAKALRAWSAETGLKPPPMGRALLISGFTVGGLGIISMIAYGGLSLGYCTENCFNPNEGAYFGVAGTAVVAGVGMVIAGGILSKRHRLWREQDSTVQLTPTFALVPTGAHFGVAGRF
jgi:hypothetical protein